MREVTEKLKITDKNCLDREQYGKKLEEIQVLAENIEKNGRIQVNMRKDMVINHIMVKKKSI